MKLPWQRRKPREHASLGPPTFAQLRTLLLSTDPSSLHLEPSADLPRVWAAVVEMRLGPNVASLVAVADGSVSLYTSAGGGVIGGGEHAAVRAMCKRFLECAEASIGLFEPRPSLALPAPDRVGFIVLTYDQKLWADGPDDEVKAGTHPLSPCYAAAQDLLTELRVASGG